MVVVVMLAIIVIRAGITLQPVCITPPPIPLNQNSTPKGYTVKLLIFNRSSVSNAVVGKTA